MGVQNVYDLSLGQWTATVKGWNKANGDDKPAPPTESEFDLAVMQVRGAA